MIKGCEVNGSNVVFKVNKGHYTLRVVGENCIKVMYSPTNETITLPSFVVGELPEYTGFRLNEHRGHFIIEAASMRVAVDKKYGRISVENKFGAKVVEGLGITSSSKGIMLDKAMPQNTNFYGLGEKTGFLDKKGREYLMWNTDEPSHTPLRDPLYKSVPFLIEHSEHGAAGIFVDRTCRVWFDIGYNNPDTFSIRIDDDEVECYIFSAPTIKEVISDYTGLTGRMKLPPKWALGYQQCRWGYKSGKDVKLIADTFRKKQIPCDVIYLDIDYMKGYRVFTWNERRFKSPTKLIKKLRQQGFKIVTIVDPAVKKDGFYDIYKDGAAKDVYCKHKNGKTYLGKAWAGLSAYPDFTKEQTKRWWADNHVRLFDKGVAGIWNDMNEPTDFLQEKGGDRTTATVPDKVLMDNNANPQLFSRCHNIYGYEMCAATHRAFEQHCENKRPFIVTRSAYAGIQKYAAVWTGDNHSWWEHLAAAIPMYLNIGLSGMPFVGGDVGGFQQDASPELFARWMQFAAFVPFFRGHSNIDTKPHEPWAFGEQTEQIARDYIRLRYKLMPYIYSEMHTACRSGLPVMRPLVLDYPEDKNTALISAQFLLGEQLLVAPIYRPDSVNRSVYLPAGRWYDYWTDKIYEGEHYYLADAPLERIPLFVRAGSIIPTTAPQNYIGENNSDEITLEVYTGAEGNYKLYEDDGLTLEYEKGDFLLTEFALTGNEVSIINQMGNYRPNRKKFEINLH